MGSIAFFDVDKTLLSVNSASLWVKKELRDGRIKRRQAAHAALWIGLYNMGFVRADDVVREAIGALRGRAERDVIDRTLAFWEQEVRHLVRPGAREAIARHKGDGDLIFLLTSSSNYLCAPIADELKCDGFLANRFVVEGGVFTGAPVEPICFGAGKIDHARAVSAKLHVPLSECTFYTDSASDIPMLEAVGVPVVVHPDRRLARHAQRRGWRVEDWGTP